MEKRLRQNHLHREPLHEIRVEYKKMDHPSNYRRVFGLNRLVFLRRSSIGDQLGVFTREIFGGLSLFSLLLSAQHRMDREFLKFHSHRRLCNFSIPDLAPLDRVFKTLQWRSHIDNRKAMALFLSACHR